MSEELRRGIPRAIVVGKAEDTEEERKRDEEMCENLLKRLGVLEENESIQDFKVKQQ